MEKKEKKPIKKSGYFVRTAREKEVNINDNLCKISPTNKL